MQAIAHNPSFARKAGVPQSVGKEFSGDEKLDSSLPTKVSSKRKSKTLGKMSK